MSLRHAAYLRELRITLDLHAPALIVGQVHVERVEFVLRHQIEIILDLFLVEEVAGDVQQQAAPAKARAIFDAYGRYRPRHRPLRLGRAEDLRRQKLQQGLHAVEQAGTRGGGNHDIVAPHVQRVALGAEGGVCILALSTIAF